MIGGAVRWATSKVDENVVSPVANRLANSVANPYVLSFFIWERIKEMTPQRARDLSRLLSTALANAVDVLGAEQGKALKDSTTRLQSDLVGAAVSRQGRDVVLNSVAAASKVAQALATPESRAATAQVVEALQSAIDLLASEPGRRAIASAGDCVAQLCAVAASPEAAVFLAELATNVCHALEAEAQRRDAELDAAANALHRDSVGAAEHLEAKPDAHSPPPPSPTASMADTAFETESTVSHAHGAGAHSGAAAAARRSEPRAARSARIERDVLLKMGVAPAMIGEIQRVLDAAAAEEEAALMRLEDAAAEQLASELDAEALTDSEDAPIAFAFGSRAASPPPSEAGEAADPAPSPRAGDVLLPEWHAEPLRLALRRRHARDAERAAQRDAFDAQAREMAGVLAARRVRHGELAPADVLACRAISRVIVYGLAFVLLLLALGVFRALFLRS